jgi:hypothetical protein
MSAMFAAIDERGAVRAGGGFSSTWATYFGTAAVTPTHMDDLGSVVTGPFAGGSGSADKAYIKTIPGVLLCEGIAGPVSGDFLFDLFDPQASFNDMLFIWRENWSGLRVRGR